MAMSHVLLYRRYRVVPWTDDSSMRLCYIHPDPGASCISYKGADPLSALCTVCALLYQTSRHSAHIGETLSCYHGFLRYVRIPWTGLRLRLRLGLGLGLGLGL